MNQNDFGALIGIAVLFISFVCGIVLVSASMHNNQKEEDDEQDERKE